MTGWISREEAIMGTSVRVELWHDDRASGLAAAVAVIEEMHRIDRTMSPYKEDSELSRINREAGERPVAISPEMFRLLHRSLAFSRMSDGAFDITFASVGHLYDYRERRKPSDAELERTLPALNYRHIELNEKRQTIRFADPHVRIDLGGIAKGHAVDNSVHLLKTHGVREAMVSAGGDSRVLGTKRGRPWIVGVRDPRKEGAMVAMIPLIDAAISTSGDYERYFDADGVRHHHILNPTTGRSAEGIRSVTIIGPDATTTEGLSKTVFIKGVQAGLRLINTLPGIDAVIVDDVGRLHYSAGLQETT